MPEPACPTPLQHRKRRLQSVTWQLSETVQQTAERETNFPAVQKRNKGKGHGGAASGQTELGGRLD